MEHRFRKFYHKCDQFPQDPIKAVTVDTETNWAWNSAHPENSAFPVYKECCHFFKIKKNGEPGYEVDMKSRFPKLLK